jgi:hypothetical protein
MESQFEGVENKKDRVGAGGAGKGEFTVALQKYTPAFRARAGSTKDIFFLLY